MDIDLLKTFLEVKNTRHFSRAADNLYLTQAAVSARIKQLEKTIGAPLFTRYRNNLQMTPTGERLVPHAEAILIAWERARQDVSLKHEQKFVFSLGATTGLWDLYLQDSLIDIYRGFPSMLIRAEAQDQDFLVRRLLERTMDLAMMYEPAKTRDISCAEIATANLVLVANRPGNIENEDSLKYYIAIDWGQSFDITHAQLYPGAPPPVMHTSLARIALDFILLENGSAYLPEKLVQPYLGEKLHVVEDAPVIPRPVYLAWHSESRHTEVIEKVTGIISTHTEQDPVIQPV